LASDSDVTAASDTRILSLFEGAGAVETPTAGMKAWIAYDSAFPGRPILIKRTSFAFRGRATEALALRHPNIIPPRRWLADGVNLYVVRDVQRGKNIRQALAAGSGARPSTELFRRIFLPLISALEMAHARGVTHGGISPENIIIGEDGTPYFCDFATTDPGSTAHFSAYKGKSSVEGDIKAFSRVLATYLPNTGPFASLAVRGRIEGLLNRCDTLTDLRATIDTLDRLAASASPSGVVEKPATTQPASTVPPVLSPPVLSRPVLSTPETSRPTNEGMPTLRPITAPETETGALGSITSDVSGADLSSDSVMNLEVALQENSIRIPQGGGGAANLTLTNRGAFPVSIRSISTQHAWLNVRPIELPLVLPMGSEQQLTLNVSAARLTPGDYRSEIYVIALRPDANPQLAPSMYSTELRVSVESPGLPTATPPESKPPYPANAPSLPGSPGCGVLFALVSVLLTAGMIAAQLH